MAEAPKKISKNVEMTGERTRAYDLWRANLSLNFIGLPFVEYSRLPTKSWPRFTINAMVFPSWSEDSSRHDVNGTMANSHGSSKSIISLIDAGVLLKEIPVFDVYLDSNFQVFEYRRPDAKSGLRVDSAEFIKTVLKQKPETIVSPFVFETESSSAAYSAWHRVAMPSSAGVMDIDFVELRNGEPVALIEATKANSADLEYGLFSFLSRGFAQASIYIQLAELLSTDAYVVTYTDEMQEVEVLKLSRSMISHIDDFDRKRQQLAKEFLGNKAAQSRSQAQGMAVGELFADGGQEFLRSLIKQRRKWAIGEYVDWLTNKAPLRSRGAG